MSGLLGCCSGLLIAGPSLSSSLHNLIAPLCAVAYRPLGIIQRDLHFCEMASVLMLMLLCCLVACLHEDSHFVAAASQTRTSVRLDNVKAIVAARQYIYPSRNNKSVRRAVASIEDDSTCPP